MHNWHPQCNYSGVVHRHKLKDGWRRALQAFALTLITSWAARPPMKALMGAKSPRAVKDRRLTAASSSSSSCATAFSFCTMPSRVSASGCKGRERFFLFFFFFFTGQLVLWNEWMNVGCSILEPWPTWDRRRGSCCSFFTKPWSAWKAKCRVWCLAIFPKSFIVSSLLSSRASLIGFCNLYRSQLNQDIFVCGQGSSCLQL